METTKCIEMNIRKFFDEARMNGLSKKLISGHMVTVLASKGNMYFLASVESDNKTYHFNVRRNASSVNSSFAISKKIAEIILK